MAKRNMLVSEAFEKWPEALRDGSLSKKNLLNHQSFPTLDD